MLKRLYQRITGQFEPKPTQLGVVRQLPVQVAADRPLPASRPIPVYPPIDAGIELADASAVMASQDELIAKLRRHLALPEEQFRFDYMEPIWRVAERVGLLPATKAENHSGQGGLFRLALETAYASARSADGVVFGSNSPIDERRQVELAWRHATFLAGLACELHRPLTDMVIVGSSGETWSPYLGALNEWGAKHHLDRVFVRWVDYAVRPAGNQAVALWVLSTVAGAEIMAKLHRADPAIAPVMAAVVAGVVDRLQEPTMARLVRQALEGVRARDIAQKPQLYGLLTQGSHLEPWLLDSMRTLLVRGDWRVNERGSALLWTKDGLYLRWPQTAQALAGELASRGHHGVPVHPSTLAEMLMTAGVVLRSPQNMPTWQTMFPGDQEASDALRFARPDVVLAALGPEHTALPQPIEPAGGDEAISRNAAAPSREPVGIPQVPICTDGGATNTTEEAASHAVAGQDERGAGSGAGASVPAGSKPQTPCRPERSQPVAAPGVPMQASVPEPVAPSVTASGARQAPALGATGGESNDAGEASPRRKPGAPIVLGEEKPAMPNAVVLDRQLVAELGGPAVAGLLGEWAGFWNSGQKRQMFQAVQGGLAIRMEILAGSGMEVQEVFKPLRENGWLKLHQRPGGLSAPVAEIEFVGPKGTDKAFAFVLTEAFARRAGFVL